MHHIKRFIPVILSLALACSIAVPCTAQAASKPKLSATKLVLEVGSSKKLTVKNTKQKVTWSSGKPSVATVNSKGTVKGISAGKTVIKAKINKTSLKCAVTVTEQVALDASSVELYSGNQTTLNLQNAGSVSWTSDNDAVAKVNSKGVVTAVDKGTCNIIATNKNTKKTYICKVTVNRKHFALYNGLNETKVIPTGCTTFKIYSLRQFLKSKGDTISANATWTSSDESILYKIPDYDVLRAVGFGTITLTVQSGSKTFVYDVDVVKENPYALTYEDFNVINSAIDDSYELEIKEGASFNFIEKFPTQKIGDMYSRVSYSILDEEDRLVQTSKGIKLGSSVGDVYAAYGFNYMQKWDSQKTYLNVNGHVATNNMICHLGLRDKDICYTLSFVFDQNNEVICFEYAAHMFHGE